jgi:hypothetical protein
VNPVNFAAHKYRLPCQSDLDGLGVTGQRGERRPGLSTSQISVFVRRIYYIQSGSKDSSHSCLCCLLTVHGSCFVANPLLIFMHLLTEYMQVPGGALYALGTYTPP